MEIEKFYCINLNKRPDRWQHAQNEFKTHFPDETLNRFPAIEKKPGWMGCTQSHIQIFELSKNIETFMVLEDDFEFQPGIASMLSNIENQLPSDWEILYLGANFRSANMQDKLKRYSQNLFTCQQAYGTYAYLVNNKNGFVDTILQMKDEIRKIDVFYCKIVQKFERCFVTYPLLATQIDGFSDITRKNTNYKNELIESYNLITQE